MPPEYFSWEPGSDASDQFSLGVIAYFLLSGKYPYAGHSRSRENGNAQRRLRYQLWCMMITTKIPVWWWTLPFRKLCILPEKRYEQLFEFIHDLCHPNPALDRKILSTADRSHPVAVWRGISSMLALLLALPNPFSTQAQKLELSMINPAKTLP